MRGTSIPAVIWFELWRMLATVAAITALGAVFGASFWGLVIGLLVVLCRHLWAEAQLLLWLQSSKQRDLPDGVGLWAEIYDRSLARYQRSRKRKKRLSNILKEFQASTRALPDAAIALDPRGRITWFNQAAQDLLGLAAKRDKGQRVANLIRHPDFVSYLAATESGDAGVEIPAPDRPEMTIWVRVIPYGRQQRLLIARDVTERTRIERLRRDFVGNASHELRTPLTVINGYLEMMVSTSNADGELAGWRTPVLEMHRQAQRMESMIGDMLRLSTVENRRPAVNQCELPMPQLLSECLEEARLISAGRHQLQSEIDETLLLLGQREEVASIISNLLTNAVRYTAEGGQITLRWFNRGHTAVLEVEDNGIGIAESELPRITERFYRADVARSRATGGTGLGLAIVKHALERHEGVLQVSSQPGEGSTFRCVFPQGWRNASATPDTPMPELEAEPPANTAR